MMDNKEKTIVDMFGDPIGVGDVVHWFRDYKPQGLIRRDTGVVTGFTPARVRVWNMFQVTHAARYNPSFSWKIQSQALWKHRPQDESPFTKDQISDLLQEIHRGGYT